MSYFGPEFLNFFKELAANNDRDWFNANKKHFKKDIEGKFLLFLEDLITEMKKIDPKIDMKPKEAMFRIYRDIRFSKDKTPYKLHLSAAISRGGRKDMTSPGIYVQAGPEDFRIYSGVYQPDKDTLYQIRSYIVENLDQFDKAVSKKEFKETFGEIRGEKNKIIPKEFKDAGQQQPLVYNKQLYWFAKYDPEFIYRDDLIDEVVRHFKISQPLKDFFEEAMRLSTPES